MVSVIIPVFNEEKTIEKCLGSLTLQTADIPFEVIIVDNNSTDKTLKIVDKFKKKLNLKVIKETKQGRGVARSVGFDKAKGDIILSTDADTRVPRNWIDNMVSHFINPKVAAVTGPWRIRSHSKTKNFIANNLLNLSLPFLDGKNFGIRKKVYKVSGGFDKSLKVQEDLDLALRVKKFGKIKYAKDVAVKTSSRRYKNGLLSGWWEYSKANFYIFLLKDKNSTIADRR